MKKKRKIWENIAAKVSSLGVAVRTVKEVKDKWSNCKKIAKKSYSESRKEINKTGGGPAPKAPSLAVQKIINMCKDSASFRGLNGVETLITLDKDIDNPNEAALPEEDAIEDSFVSAASTASPSPRSPTPPPPPESPAVADCPIRMSPRLPVLASRSRPGPSRQEQSVTKKAPKRKYTAEDVYEMQYKLYERELERQDKENQKLDLQIVLLKNLTNPQLGTPNSPNINQLFASMF